MANKQELRSEETRNAILSGARKLFAAKGFDAVTMRDIAREAGCSHTTIYIYFKDKEALLHQLSMAPLRQLEQRLLDLSSREALSPEDLLKQASREMIGFCLQNRSMYMIFFGAKSARVDEREPKLAINRLRNELFAFLQRALQACIPVRQDSDALMCARIYFFTLQGIIGTYSSSEESVEGLMERLTPTFDGAVEVLLLGFRQKLNGGVEGR